MIDSLKFDLRIYVLVTGLNPLRIFIHEDGLARFATECYEAPDRNNVGDKFRHLTNYAINKTSEHWADDSKRTLTEVYAYMK